MKSFDLSSAYMPAVVALQHDFLNLATLVRSIEMTSSNQKEIQQKIITAIEVRDVLGFVELAQKSNREQVVLILSLFPENTKIQTIKQVVRNIAALLTHCDEDPLDLDQIALLNLNVLDTYIPMKLHNMNVSKQVMKYIDFAKMQSDFLAQLGDSYIEIETPDGLEKFVNREKLVNFILEG